MTVKEFCEKKAQELREKGNKNVCVKRIEACEVGRNSYSVLLFNPGTVPQEAEVTSERPEKGMTKGVCVTISLVPPRCRKEQREYFHMALV